MFDIRDHGGPFGGSNELKLKPGALTIASSPETYKYGSSLNKALKRIKIHHPGTVRASFTAYVTSSTTGYVQLYKNGSPIGIERVVNYTATYVTFTEDITIKKDDVIEVYARRSGTGEVWISNYLIQIDGEIGATVIA